MLSDLAGTVEVATWIIAYLMILARLTFIMFFLPGIGEQVVPVRIRLMALLGVSATFAMAGIAPTVPPITGSTDLLLLLLTEIAIGFVLGAVIRVAIWMLTIAGEVIAQSIGLANFLGVAMETEAQTVVSNLLAMAGAALLLSVDFHLSALVGVLRLYNDIPIGALALLDIELAVDSLFAGFGFALLIAWPFAAVNLLYQICLGFINKALPQLMVAFVGAPFMVGAGLVLMAVSIVALLMVWQSRVFDLVLFL